MLVLTVLIATYYQTGRDVTSDEKLVSKLSKYFNSVLNIDHENARCKVAGRRDSEKEGERLRKISTDVVLLPSALVVLLCCCCSRNQIASCFIKRRKKHCKYDTMEKLHQQTLPNLNIYSELLLDHSKMPNYSIPQSSTRKC